jgi:hypothetical protein
MNSAIFKKPEAAAYLGVAPRTLDDWRAAGVIACIERPGYVRFLKSDLDDFLLRHRKEPRRETAYRPRPAKTAGNTSTPSVAAPPASHVPANPHDTFTPHD